MGRRVKMMLGSAYEGWRPGVREGGVYYDGDPSTTERALVVTGATAPGEGRDLGREKRILVGLHHPHVLRVLSLALAPGRPEPVFAYAFTDSVSMARLMRTLRAERGLLPWGVVVAVVEAVAAAGSAVVRAAGEYRGFAVFHPGPTPDDILLDDQGVARTCGFELWRDGSHVQSSPGYGCPMGALGEPGMVYGLGALLVEMLSGERPPAAGRSIDRHREVIRRVQIKVLARPGDRLPQTLVDLVAECLSHTPETRPSLDDLVLKLGELADRAPVPQLHPWAARVVVALRAGETLTESVMAADPRFGMGPPAAHGEDLDPDFRPTTIDPERADAVARLGVDAADELEPDMDSLHGVLAPPVGGAQAWRPEHTRPAAQLHRRTSDFDPPSTPIDADDRAARIRAAIPSRPVHDPAVPGSYAPDSDAALTEPLGARPPQFDRPLPAALPRSSAPSAPSAQAVASPPGQALVAQPASLPPPPPIAGDPSPPAEREPAAPSTEPAEGPSRGVLFVGAVALVVVALAAGWVARGIGTAPPPEPPVPEAAVPADVAPPSPASEGASPDAAIPTTDPIAAPLPPETAPEPPAAPPGRSRRSRTPKTPPAPANTAAEPVDPPAPAPPASNPADAAEETAPAAPAVFDVVFRSADPTVTQLTVKCHQSEASGSATVTVKNAEPGPCRVTGQRGSSRVDAMVSVNGARTFTCFGGGSRGCR